MRAKFFFLLCGFVGDSSATILSILSTGGDCGFDFCLNALRRSTAAVRPLRCDGVRDAAASRAHLRRSVSSVEQALSSDSYNESADDSLLTVRAELTLKVALVALTLK